MSESESDCALFVHFLFSVCEMRKREYACHTLSRELFYFFQCLETGSYFCNKKFLRFVLSMNSSRCEDIKNELEIIKCGWGVREARRYNNFHGLVRRSTTWCTCLIHNVMPCFWHSLQPLCHTQRPLSARQLPCNWQVLIIPRAGTCPM